MWAGAVVTRAKKEGKIKDEFAFQTIIKEINDFRSNCGGLLAYDWIQIPLVYTQVISMFYVLLDTVDKTRDFIQFIDV